MNIEILNVLLKQDHNIKIATSGHKGLEIACANPDLDLILLDIVMPGMDGYEVCRQLKSDPSTASIPVIFVTAMTDMANEQQGLELGAADYITKPFSPAIVKARVYNNLCLKEMRDELGLLVAQRTEELELTKDATILAIASLAETRDNETGNHIRRTQYYVLAMAEHLQNNPVYNGYFDQETIRLLHKSAPLHDIGKVGIPDQILLKPGSLTGEEFKIMKTHTTLGHDSIHGAIKLLGDNSFLRFAGEIAISHHEKWDGSGYPFGLKGEEIPLSGRLMAMADIYDALISKRVYKPPFCHSKVVKIITEGDGRTIPGHFDPVILQTFSDLQEKFLEIALQYMEDDNERQFLVR